MGRGRGKGKKTVVHSHEESGGEEEPIPAYKRRGRPQKSLKEVEMDENEVENMEDVDEYDTKVDVSKKVSATPETGKKRKKNSQVKENQVDSVKEENGDGDGDGEVKSNGFRRIGSRRKSTPRRALRAGIDF
ncbi:hypothetical protein GIB67_040298 [Kingdonia uniflora]|uniref:Uncharacterized protein n=1 Tax=Kingdonia uniflora TaxID=39325 RepID=A0A7J7MVB9_9MAGN|nr:hypothetical protein GIB67_040298 [Kingdonia uniflora]